MFNSIKFKLAVWFFLFFFGFFAGLETFLYYRLKNLSQNLVDEHIKNELHTLSNLMTIEDQHGQIMTELAELSAAASGEYGEKLSGHYYQVSDSNGTILVVSQSLRLGNATLPIVKAGSRPVFTTIRGPGGVPLRMVAESADFSIGRLTFEAGDTATDVYRVLRSFYSLILIIFPIVFLICGAGVFIVTGWGLRPLKAFTARIGQITEENLSERIPVEGAAAELKPLASSFNAMMERIDESFARQKQFLSDASHELRTPTTIIKSFCDITLSRERSAAEYREAMARIGNTVDRMCAIINRILVISRFDSKAIRFKPARLDLMAVMAEVVRLMEAPAAKIGVTVGVSGESVIIKGDREGLAEVFTNLVENAVKYNRPDGRVDISVASGKGEATVVISDTGIGIPPGELKRIFDRFYRVDASRGGTAGSGLGLSIVRSIVEAHGGRIEVSSEGAGKGSVFTVHLPVGGPSI